MGKTPLLTAQEETELSKRVSEGDKAARERMIEANFRLVAKIAFGYAKKDTPIMLPLEDLIQEGILGLIRAVDGHDPDKGRLTTYAVPWINQNITRALDNKARSVRLPVHQEAKMRKAFRSEYELIAEGNSSPSIEEVSERAEVSPEEIEELIRATRIHISIDQPINEDDDDPIKLHDVLPDPTNEYEDLVRVDADVELVKKLFNRLSKPERRLLELKYGMNGHEPHSHQQIAEIFGFSRQSIHTFERTTLDLLKEFMEEENA